MTFSKIFQFNKKYFLLSLLLFLLEICIARYARDQFIRPYGGDYLVVILLYCMIRCFTLFSVNRCCILVLFFSYIIEVLQYFHFADRLGFHPGSIAYILLGNYFTWIDIISYSLGIATVFIFETIAVNYERETTDVKNAGETGNKL